jgi:hypothetical protein
MDAILEGLPESVKRKIGKYTSAKELWDKLEKLYMGKKEAASNKSNEDQSKSNLEEAPCKYSYDKTHFSFDKYAYANESCCLPNMSESENSEDEEVVVDLEEKLISSLDELRKERQKNEHLKRDLLAYEEILYQKEDVDTLKM